ncbi:MAG: hypothetical protein FJX45_06455, partial [Alphaproteobacteria bacterium]|nr:hypothetical protein [Alphaproteobacteria bacterium]
MTEPFELQEMTQPSPALPIVPAMSVSLGQGEARRLREIAARIAESQPAIISTRPFGTAVRSGLAAGLWLLIGDAREIALAARGESTTYEYRLSLLARDGDLVVFGREPLPEFTRYRAEQLGLGSIVSLNPRSGPRERLLPLAERCRLDREVFSRIVEKTRSAGGLTILPHIGMGSAWRLGAAVAAASGQEVLLASSPPGLTRRVNDKLWFARLVEEVVGEAALPKTHSAYGPAVLAHRLRALARSTDQVVVKVPDSAGGSGNICLESREIAERPLSEIRNRVLRLLRATSWRDAYPLLVGVWEAPVVSSPSVQLWIPREADGQPIIEGIFEQILEGREGSFVGSVPGEFSPSWRWRLA